jgi:hypothetical protein
MNEQRQEIGKLNLDLWMTTSKISGIEPPQHPIHNQSDRPQSNTLLMTTDIQPHASILPRIVEDVDVTTRSRLDLADLKAGTNWLEIQHSNYAKDRQKPYYSTNITNRSTENIRIDRFATYTPTGESLVLHSITGGFFSPQQFQEWYDLGKRIWIEPGQVVTDPNNHSNIGVYWVYFGTTASGQQFIAGSPWNGKPWWQLW